MKCALIVGDWNKNKTHSFDFFEKLLKTRFSVKSFSGPTWKQKHCENSSEINSFNPDILILCQTLPTISYLKKLNCKNLVWLPMYDGKAGWQVAILKSIIYTIPFNLKVICFSEKLFQRLKYFFNCQHYQYFPKPNKQVKYTKKKLFFWERRANMDWENTISNLFDLQTIHSLTIKQSTDPHDKIPPIKKRKKLTLIDTWLSEKDYHKILSSNNIYVAPRRSEGIGHSFLEAMAKGYAVIAYNESTMNEYITDKKTGYLFNKVDTINLKNFDKIGKNAYKYISKNYKLWTKSKEKMLDWIEKIN
jgi:hypothetical protein